jgi:prolyl-tRNA editing enzyme YbaK/EbsC (Cys-tRNA(Pro) deacylase)
VFILGSFLLHTRGLFAQRGEIMKGPQRVQTALHALGVEIEVLQLDASARTAPEAAAAIGTELGSIVKSLVFLADGKAVLVLVAGDRRADPGKLKHLFGARHVVIADADQVRELTGFAIGGVPPVGHSQPLPVWIDRSLSRFETVYAAAGGPRAIFPIAYSRLIELTGGHVADLAQ